MKLLIIEDDQSVAELERDYLEINGGFDCTLCTDGTEGLRRALAEDYAARSFFADYGFHAVGTLEDGRTRLEKDIRFLPEFLGETD